jgi:serine-type D-Ala-D-Ala carboxypeptidase/endopeptidase (penicillin-binding protein 4)
VGSVADALTPHLVRLLPSVLRRVVHAAPLGVLFAACTPHRPEPPLAPTPVRVPEPPPVAAPAATRPTTTLLQRLTDSIVQAPPFRSAQWGVLIMDPATGDTLASHSADKLFMPASNMKLITGAMVVDRPASSWVTTLTLRGDIRDSVLSGDVQVSGTFDPSLSDAVHGDVMRLLQTVGDSLRRHGVRRITGDVVIDAPDGLPQYGFGWAWDDLLESYSAGSSTVLFNEGVAMITLRACADRRTLCAQTRPAHSVPVVRGILVNQDSTRLISIERDPRDSLGATLIIRAAVRPGDSIAVEVAQPNPHAALRAALREALVAAGIVVGRTAVGARRDGPTRTITLTPPDAQAVLRAMLQPSQNQMAEMMFRSLAPAGVRGAAIDSAARAITERRLVAWGAFPDGFAVRDGSGLSRHDYLTPRTILRVLDTLYRTPSFERFRTALPAMGVSGTLRNRLRGTAVAGRVFAKTGTLDKARSLSGYARTADDRWVLFSIMTNNWTAPRVDVDRAQDLLVTRIVTTPLAALRTRQ